ncbi:O-Antigen ligase [Rivularia sp. PCC 7116]|uniref:O-antigen ligase family protein n=1 Tax=Rivularia sp. PCC 7116 TaxID=373994 RepID=UPI00029F3FB4|nr:O-antigen ligase family protein [Rivularia sp. PCC 7116]AFY58138.1 O-Antigen ligase [Rivularia sp. PCC 7116]
MKPQNFEESLIWYVIIGTYVIYALGLVFPVYSSLAWILSGYLVFKLLLQTKTTPVEEKITVPWLTWLWGICSLITLVATYVGITDFNLGTNALLRSILGWLTSTAIIPLFLLSGCLNIRPQLIYRAVCILCLQSLVAIPIAYAAYAANLPDILYTSPIERLIQNGPIFHNVGFYTSDYGADNVRLFLFTPWCPALGLVSNVYFFMALQESNKKWKYIGIIGAIAMNIVSLSRAALISLPLVLIVLWGLRNFTRPLVQIAAGLICFTAGIFSSPLSNAATEFIDSFHKSRADSSRVRAALQRVGIEAWKEAPIWGHGVQKPGPPVLANLPIGSHHTWIGLLYTKGLVGFMALFVPVLLSLLDLFIKAEHSKIAETSFSILLILILFSFGEQIDILGYIIWPGLIIMGIAFKQKIRKPVFVFS